MITVRLQGFDLAIRMLGADGKRVRTVAAMTLTQVAENARMDTVRQIKQKLNMPTDYTVQSMFKSPATAARLESRVFLKDFGRVGGSRGRTKSGKSQADVLGHLFSGGSRNWKSFEGALLRTGLMPRGMAAVPGEGCRLDAYGNIPKGFITQMLAYFQAQRDTSANMTDAGRAKFGKRQAKAAGVGGVAYFVSRGKGNWSGRRSWKHGRMQQLPPGIWMRASAHGGSAVKPIIMFVRAPRYKQYFDLEEIARVALRRDWDATFSRIWNEPKKS